MDRLDWVREMVLKAFDSYLETSVFAAPELRDFHANQFQLKVISIINRAKQELQET